MVAELWQHSHERVDWGFTAVKELPGFVLSQ